MNEPQMQPIEKSVYLYRTDGENFEIGADKYDFEDE